MTEADIEIILERAKERYPGVRPRVISDNGPQFIAKDFKEFIRLSGTTLLRRALQQRAFEQCHRLHHAKDMLAGISRRFRPSGIGSWKRGAREQRKNRRQRAA